MKLAALQMTSGPDVAANLAQARGLLEEAAARGQRLPHCRRTSPSWD